MPMEERLLITMADIVYEVDSILVSVKKALGIPEDHEEFDSDILMHINSTFSKLYQMGVGPRDEVFRIYGKEDLWDDYIQDKTDLEMVKSFMYIEVQLMFDPPTASLLTSLQERQKEYEWRLTVAGSNYDEEEMSDE